jgi:diguanylate cyclase (GGDEF)-like protein
MRSRSVESLGEPGGDRDQARRLLGGMLDAALHLVESPRGSLMLLDEQKRLLLREARGLRADWIAAPARDHRDGPAGRALAEDRPLHLLGPRLGQAQVEESLILPLRTSQGPAGTLNLSREGGTPWSPRLREQAIAFSASVSQALDVVRQGQDRDRRMAELDRVLAFSRIFGSTRELSKILELLLSCARELSGCQASLVTLYTPAGESHEAWAGHCLSETVLRRLVTGLRQRFGHRFFARARPDVHDRLHDLEEGHPLRLLADEGLASSAVVVPLVFGYRILGRLYLLDADEGRLHRDTLRLLMLLAQEATIAIDQGRAIRELQELAFVDPLTRVFNRNYWIQRFEEELVRGERRGQPLSLLMIDIDHFKAYNDTYGHLVGDEVLRMTAQVIKSCLREVDVVGRFGGEEFGVLLPDTDEGGADFVAERIRRSVMELELGHRLAAGDGGGGAPGGGGLTISLGCYTSHGGRRESAADIIRAADTALLYSKARGRNRVSVYWPDGVRPGSTTPAEPERGDGGNARLAGTSEFLFRMADSLTRSRLDPVADNARFGFNILIAGGQAGDGLMLERLFTDLGYHTLVRNNGARALAAARRQPLDLVILDLDLKDLDGLQLLRAMKERDPYLPVIVLAERENLQAAIEGVRQGADDYILKPFGVDEIRASVDTAFSKRIRIMKERQDGSPRESELDLDMAGISIQARREFAAGARDLRLLEEFNRRSIENLMHGVLLLDSAFRVIHLNRLALEMAGITKPEGMPLPLAQLAPGLADERLLLALEQVLAGQEQVVLNDLWLPGPDGTTRGLHKVVIQRTPLADEEYLLVQFENILDSRLLQEETRKVRMQVARQIYGRVAQHLQVIAGRGELLQQRDGAHRAELGQMLDSAREIGRILTELGTDMHEPEPGMERPSNGTPG